MGNVISLRKTKSKESQKSSLSRKLPSEPGRPVVELAAHPKFENSEVSDEVIIKWKAPMIKGEAKIQGYVVEMWDLGLSEWIRITGTEDPSKTECQLSNILSGMLYKFRVTAVTEAGLSSPSLPSEPFLVNIPGVGIAPYWVSTPTELLETYTLHESISFSVQALGTPKPHFRWFKDEEEIFLANGVSIRSIQDGSRLIVDNLQIDDEGLIKVVAANILGKIEWEFLIRVISPPLFEISHKTKKVRLEDSLRVTIPLVAYPAVTKLGYSKENPSEEDPDLDIVMYADNLLLKIDSICREHAGIWIISAENEHGSAEFDLDIKVEDVPRPKEYSTPLIVDSDKYSVEINWDIFEDAKEYIIEYYRDKWNLWLKASSCKNNNIIISDLVPGSYYKFRIRGVNDQGIGPPGLESESIYIGSPLDDEDSGTSFKKSVSLANFDGIAIPSQNLRSGVSLEREVYYDNKNSRREIVTYRPTAHESMTLDEKKQFTKSMSLLISKLKNVSEPPPIVPNRRKRKSLLNSTQYFILEDHKDLYKTKSVSDIKSSLNDVRGRISSMQSLLETSREIFTDSQGHINAREVHSPIPKETSSITEEGMIETKFPVSEFELD